MLAPGGRVVIEDHMWNRPRADATADSRGRKLARRVEEGWRFTIWEADRVRALAADLGLRLIDDIDCDPGRVERTMEVQAFMTWWNTCVGAVYLPWAWCAGALVALATGRRDRARRLGPRSFCINWQTSDAMLAAFALHRSKDVSNRCLVFEKR